MDRRTYLALAAGASGVGPAAVAGHVQRPTVGRDVGDRRSTPHREEVDGDASTPDADRGDSRGSCRAA